MATAIIPGFRYRDAPAAIDFLCRAFGFARHAVHANEKDPAIIDHAQLVLDGAMIMLGSARDDDERQGRYRWLLPDGAGGVTGSLYVVVADPDAHAEQARREGAEIVDEPKDNEGYPGRGYSARDPEGYLWHFGSYDPWAG